LDSETTTEGTRSTPNERPRKQSRSEMASAEPPIITRTLFADQSEAKTPARSNRTKDSTNSLTQLPQHHPHSEARTEAMDDEE